MFIKLPFGPREFWRSELCRVGDTGMRVRRVFGSWYWVRYRFPL
jgi:hypothetical protein